MAGDVSKGTDEQKLIAVGGYLSTPFEIRDGKIKIAFLGDAKQVKNLLQMLDDQGLRFKIASLADAKFSPDRRLIAQPKSSERFLFQHLSMDIMRLLGELIVKD